MEYSDMEFLSLKSKENCIKIKNVMMQISY